MHAGNLLFPYVSSLFSVSLGPLFPSICHAFGLVPSIHLKFIHSNALSASYGSSVGQLETDIRGRRKWTRYHLYRAVSFMRWLLGEL